MYISERKLRKMIRHQILFKEDVGEFFGISSTKEEPFPPTKLFYPVTYGSPSEPKKRVKSLYLGRFNKFHYIYANKDIPQGYSPVKNNEAYQKILLKAVAILMGNKEDVVKNANLEKLKSMVNEGKEDGKRADKILGYLAAGKVFDSAGLGKLFEEKSVDDLSNRWEEFMKDTGFEFGSAVFGGAAALAAATPGAQGLAFALEGLGNTFNLEDIKNKLSKTPPDYVGAFFGVLGLIPGGDSANIIKKLGGVDILPSGLAKEIGEFIYKAVDGDMLKSLEATVKSFIDDQDIDSEPGIIVQGLQAAGRKIAAGFDAVAEKESEDTDKA